MLLAHVEIEKTVITPGVSFRGVCKTRTGYLRMADADGKMRIEKCGWKKKNADSRKSKKKKKRNVDGKKIIIIIK